MSYGTRDGNFFFEDPGGSGRRTRYYLTIESEGPRRGEITIREPSGFNLATDRIIGTIPLDNQFRPNIEGSTPQEQAYFNRPEVQRRVKNQAVRTAENANLNSTQARQLIFPNTATEGGTGGETESQSGTGDNEGGNGGSENVESRLSDRNRNSLRSGIEGGITRTNGFGNLRYPLDLNVNIPSDQKQDVIKFTIKSYGSRGIGENLRFSNRSFGNPIGYITMPIQPRISDSNTVNWSGLSMDSLSMGAAAASLGIIEEGFSASNPAGISELKKLFTAEKNNLETAIKVKLAQEAASTQNLLSRLSGAIVNPNLELLFEGPGLRTFAYTFELSARSQLESEQIAKIIRTFKESMAVQRTETQLFLKAPYVFDIQYLFKDSGDYHPYINRVKGPCALTNCSVDYTPSGSYMTLPNGVMVSYSLSLTFEELEPVYADDYVRIGNQNVIGY